MSCAEMNGVDTAGMASGLVADMSSINAEQSMTSSRRKEAESTEPTNLDAGAQGKGCEQDQSPTLDDLARAAGLRRTHAYVLDDRPDRPETDAERLKRQRRESKARQRDRAAAMGRQTVTIESVPADRVGDVREAARRISEGGEGQDQQQLTLPLGYPGEGEHLIEPVSWPAKRRVLIVIAALTGGIVGLAIGLLA